MDEGRKRVLAIVAGILVARQLKTADDLFGGPQGSPRTNAMIAAAGQWGDLLVPASTGLFLPTDLMVFKVEADFF